MESLRLLPPVPGTPRVAAKDMHVGGVFIPKGTLLPIHVRLYLPSLYLQGFMPMLNDLPILSCRFARSTR